jgi:hypothetical protein
LALELSLGEGAFFFLLGLEEGDFFVVFVMAL